MHVDHSIALEDGPRLDFELVDGQRLTLAAGNPTTAKGSAQNPMPHEEVIDKARRLVAPIFGEEVADELVGAVEHLDSAPDLTELMHALRARTESSGLT
jgi:hypothetical protein